MNPYLKQEKKTFIHTFNRHPILFKKARGHWLWDEKGKKYLDFFSGLAVCGVGHSHAKVLSAIKTQSQKIIHASNLFYTDPQIKLSHALTKRWPGSKVFFSNSGAEANEMAIKLARLWGTRHKKAGREIISFNQSFHGRTLATLAATGGKKSSKDPFAPYPAGFKSIPFNDVSRLKKAVSNKTIAVIFEPIQGEGGIHVATRPFLKKLKTLARQRNFLLIADEIQTGMGRTGTFFAFEQLGIQPDIVSLAKGIAGGLPLGATLAKPHVTKWVKPGMHGSTFGGNPVACAASLEVLKLLTSAALKNMRKSGDYFKSQLASFRVYSNFKELRGRGLMVGIELNCPGAPYVALAQKMGLLINCTQKNVLRFLPPYFLPRQDMDRGIKILHSVFQQLN